MATVHLKGRGLNDWIAEQLVRDHGPQEALVRTSGPMRKAVERVIAANNGEWPTPENEYPLGYMQGRGAA